MTNSTEKKLRYRLALDLGTTSIGWALVRLNVNDEPSAIIKAGVRIFNNGRDPKTSASLAVERREKRAMRRRRDRLLRRKNRLMKLLLEFGFFPKDEKERKTLVNLDPYAIRAKGLDHALKPEEFARALFHINQRRGFKSNRKTDTKEKEGSVLKDSIKTTRSILAVEGYRTIGEWLHSRYKNGFTVRARPREISKQNANGKTQVEKSYDLYVDRAMVEAEFDALWTAQSSLNPDVYTATAHDALKDCLLYQRPLKPVRPGRCTLLPDEERAPLALPSQQRFRIYQEVNNLRLLGSDLSSQELSIQQRDDIVDVLNLAPKRTFIQIKKLIGFSGQFNLEDEKRTELKGNTTSAVLSKAEHFGKRWNGFNEDEQDAIVMQLLTVESEAILVDWLMHNTQIDELTAERVANVKLAEGYGSLSAQALRKILPELRKAVITYDKAVLAAGFEHHSHISHSSTGEILDALPYYGEYLQRHVGFGSGKPEDPPEKRFGKIANPTVHIGLNQVRKLVNAVIKKYGHPTEVIIELARDLKQSQEQRKEENKRQAENQRRNERLKNQIADALGISIENVKTADLQKLILWEELSANAADRCCPYSGKVISLSMLLSAEVEIEHILPFSQTLDDSLNNKTVALRSANRIKGNRTPAQAAADFEANGWSIEQMMLRAEKMPKAKRYRFAHDGLEQWLNSDKGFLARALNDTRHLSTVAKEYLSLICPDKTRAIPGRMTALLRAKFGLNNILGLDGEKNRDDHRHHAVDACVIAVTDQGMLQRFAQASAHARERQLTRLVEDMPVPWPTYLNHVERAVNHIWVSHRPDHGYQGAMHNDTAYGLLGDGRVRHKQVVERLSVIEMVGNPERHGKLPNGEPRPYKGYKGDSNYCIEIVELENGKWGGEVISTYQAYQIVRHNGGDSRLRHPKLSCSGKPLVMRLIQGDTLWFAGHEACKLQRVVKIGGGGQITLAPHNEANVDARNRDRDNPFKYTSKSASSLQTAGARLVKVSPLGQLKFQAA